MKALIFAAGRGERLKPMTDHTPKPLVKVQNKPLIQHHIEALLTAGINDMIINVSWLKDQIIDFVNNLSKQSGFKTANFQFSIEPDRPLETGGGMRKALPMLSSKHGDTEPFVVVNADIYTDFDFSQLNTLPENHLVNLVLVKNPDHNAEGDFCVDMTNNQLMLKSPNDSAYTYAGMGLYHPDILTPPFTEPVFSIVPYIKAAIRAQLASGQIHHGTWHDVGTVKRLNELNQW